MHPQLSRRSIKSHVRTVKVLNIGIFAYQERILLPMRDIKMLLDFYARGIAGYMIQRIEDTSSDYEHYAIWGKNNIQRDKTNRKIKTVGKV